MFKNRSMFPPGTPSWALRLLGPNLRRWVTRREDEIAVTLMKRLFG